MNLLLAILFFSNAHAEITLERATEIVTQFNTIISTLGPSKASDSVSVKFNFFAEANYELNFKAVDDDLRGIKLNFSLSGLRLESPGSFLGALCHEAGHFYGGYPYLKRLDDLFSVEGQADYWSATCILLMLKNKVIKYDELIKVEGADKICNRKFTDPESTHLCSLTLSTCVEQALTNYPKNFESYADLEAFYRKGLKKQKRSDQEYPDPTCRLMSCIHGALTEERPQCWFNP